MISFFLGIPVPDITYYPEVDRYFPVDLKEIKSFEADNYWRLLFCLPIAFSIFQGILLLTVFNYETPKFLKQNQQNAKLNELMGKLYESDRISERINAIAIEGGKTQAPGYKETLCHPRYSYATLLGCSLSVLQQLSGINAVMFYSSTIFTTMGVSPRLGSGLVGFINMASTFGAIFLLKSKAFFTILRLIEFGRRTLLWTMSFLMAADLLALGISFFYLEGNEMAQIFCVIFIMLYIVLFEFSLGPIPWLYMAEIMTDKGLSIAVLLNWLMTIVMAIVTPYVISGTLFIVFGVLCAVVSFSSLKVYYLVRFVQCFLVEGN